LKRALVISPGDNVATALEDILPGDVVEVKLAGKVETLEAREEIPFGFKIALKDIPVGEKVIKYGEVIGKASTQIKRGSLVHIHNVEGTRGRGDLAHKAT
jgi:altronate dehydratase small subunit